jgi:hypothetical protein
MTNSDATQIVRDRMVTGNDHVKDVAKSLGLTPGKTAFIKMQILVADGEVPKIEGTQAQIIARTIAARKKADDYSSWGWLAARTGKPEGALKVAVAKTERIQVKGSRIVKDRAAKRAK